MKPPVQGNSEPHRSSPFRTVLVRPKFSANIGSCARVLANFDLGDCVLVSPLGSPLSDEARKRAVPPSDQVLAAMKIAATLPEALDCCTMAVGFTRRTGAKRIPIPFPELLPEIADHLAGTPGRQVALVFGNEETGLVEEELRPCTHLAVLPTAPLLPSMNLSHALAIVCSRLHELDATKISVESSPKTETAATIRELEGLFEHWQQTLGDLGMTQAGNPERLMLRIRRIFQRTRLLQREVTALRGFLSKVRNAVQRASPPKASRNLSDRSRKL